MALRFPGGKLARTTVWTGAILGARVVIQAAGLLLLVRLFDPAVYGRIASAATLAVLMGVLPTLGAGFVLMSRAPRDPRAAEDVWGYAWPLTCALGLALGILYVALAMAAAGTQTLPWSVLVLFAATELVCMPLIGLVSFALQSREQVPLSQVLQSLPFAMRAAAIVPCFFVVGEDRLTLYAVLQLGAAALALLATLWIAHRHIPLGGAPRLPTQRDLTEGATYAGAHLVAANATEIDKVLALRLIGAHETGLYAAASRVLIALMMPINALLLAVQPRLFHHAHLPSRRGRRLVSLVVVLAFAWGIAAAVALVVLGMFVPRLFGQDYAESARIMGWMAWMAPLMGARFAIGCVLMAIGGGLDRLAFELTGILVAIGGLLLLGPQWQALGIVVAMGVAEATMLALGTFMVIKRLRALGALEEPLPEAH